jgi:hypothetical protein
VGSETKTNQSPGNGRLTFKIIQFKIQAIIRFTDFISNESAPSAKALAIFIQSGARTAGKILLQQDW